MSVFEKIKMIIMDVDGVLTDGSITIDSSGNELKTFNARDGSGIKFGQRVGLKFAIITGRSSVAVDKRAKELNIKDVYQNEKKKIEAYDKIVLDYNLEDDEVCYIGDDLVDLPVMKRVGYSVCVSDAVKEVCEIADYVTKASGGKGAVREAIEKIIMGQGKWDEILSGYFKTE